MAVSMSVLGAKTELHLLAVKSVFDPGCVKTHLGRGRAELFS
jgi:hypothetical protein